MAIRGIEVRMMDELVDFLKNNDIEIAALTIPKSKAIEVADLLVANGIKAILCSSSQTAFVFLSSSLFAS